MEWSFFNNKQPSPQGLFGTIGAFPFPWKNASGKKGFVLIYLQVRANTLFL